MSKSSVPIKEFRLELSDLTYTGHDLVRPESVLAQPNGTLWTTDGRGGVTRINPDGSQQFLGGLGGNEPNGLAMTDDGSLIVANLGLGKVQKLHPDGHVEDLLTEVDGVSMTTPNFVFFDSRNRLWISVMTRERHWWPAVAAPRPDGYIVLLDEKGPRIVADGIYQTNEIRLDAQEEYLYVVETMMNHLLRFRVQPDGSLSGKEIVGPSSLGTGQEQLSMASASMSTATSGSRRYCATAWASSLPRVTTTSSLKTHARMSSKASRRNLPMARHNQTIW